MTYQSPVVWPPPLTYGGMRRPYGGIRRLATSVLPGVCYVRHLYWRYPLAWSKPAP